MGSKSKKKSGSGGYKAVPTTTQAQADRSLSGIMDKQTGIVGSLLGSLVDRGEAVMANNPGLTNFMNQVGSVTDKVNGAIAGPKSLFDELGENLGFKQKEEAAPDPVANPNGLTDEQIAQIRRSGWGGFNTNAPYNINNDMRNRFNR
jgi:hypothetical protein